jgi:hypothetical protein
MMRILIPSLLVFATFASLGFAAGPVGAAPIGIAMGTGVFTVNSAPVTGPVDLANGSELHTTVTPSDVRLENGVEMRLATRSSSTLYQDRIVLKDGALKLDHFDGYAVQTRGLTIEADSFATQAIIRTTPKTVEIASIGGTVSVRDSGAMLTRVAAGTKMAFQATGANPAGAQNQTPAQTGAAPVEKGPISDKKAILWAAGICAVGAIVVGSIAAAQGKSPF